LYVEFSLPRLNPISFFFPSQTLPKKGKILGNKRREIREREREDQKERRG